MNLNDDQVARCEKIMNDLRSMLSAGNYSEANEYLHDLLKIDRSVSELKSALIMTKSFKEHEVLKEVRKLILSLCEEKLGKQLV